MAIWYSACVITLTPGSIASSDAGGTACTSGTQPVAGTVTVTADGGFSSAINTYVLGYGCIYQGGILYAVNDTAPYENSIGGTLVSLADQTEAYQGISWDADPVCASIYQCTNRTKALDFYYGQNLAQVPGSTNSNKTESNGPGNTFQISSVLNGQNGNENSPATYAAGVCINYTETGEEHHDWYLPAICEMGSHAHCAAGTQNILDNLPEFDR